MPSIKTCLVSLLICEKHHSDSDTGKRGILTYLVLYKKTIVYDVKESIFKSKRFNVNIIIIFKEVKSKLY